MAVALAIALSACQQGGSATHRPGQPASSASEDSGLISGRVTDGSGKPIDGANISVERISPPFTSSLEGLASIADGTFESRETAGRYRVSATFGGVTLEEEIALQAGDAVQVEFEFD